jgi:hypothetical protein
LTWELSVQVKLDAHVVAVGDEAIPVGDEAIPVK